MNHELLYEDKKSDEMVAAIKNYFIDQARPQQPEINQGEVNPSLAEQEPSRHHRHDKQPDPHYFAAGGQEAPEPEPEPSTGFKAGMVELFHNPEVAVIVAVITWFLVILIIAGQQ